MRIRDSFPGNPTINKKVRGKMGGINVDGGGGRGWFEKNHRMGGAPPHTSLLLWETLSFCRGDEPPTKFSKIGGLTEPQLKGVLLGKGVTFFREVAIST